MDYRIQYHLRREDYHAFQLYFTSVYYIRKKALLVRWLFFFAVIISLIIHSYYRDYPSGITFLLFLALVIGFFYFAGTNESYKKLITRRCDETYAYGYDQQATLHIHDEWIESLGVDGQYKFKMETIRSIDETADHVFILLRSNHGYFIPKKEAANPAELVNLMKELAAEQKIPYNNRLNWKWKILF